MKPTDFIPKDLDQERVHTKHSASQPANEANEGIDTVSMTVPLFIRALEWAKENASDDLALHKFTKNAIAHDRVLDIDDYDSLIPKGQVKENCDGGATGASSIAAGPAQNLLAPINRTKKKKKPVTTVLSRSLIGKGIYEAEEKLLGEAGPPMGFMPGPAPKPATSALQRPWFLQPGNVVIDKRTPGMTGLVIKQIGSFFYIKWKNNEIGKYGPQDYANLMSGEKRPGQTQESRNINEKHQDQPDEEYEDLGKKKEKTKKKKKKIDESISPETFKAIRALFRKLADDNAANAQGDNGWDIQRREEIYREKLEKLLDADAARSQIREDVEVGDTVIVSNPSFYTYKKQLKVLKVEGDKVYAGGKNFKTMPYPKSSLRVVSKITELDNGPKGKEHSDNLNYDKYRNMSGTYVSKSELEARKKAEADAKYWAQQRKEMEKRRRERTDPTLIAKRLAQLGEPMVSDWYHGAINDPYEGVRTGLIDLANDEGIHWNKEILDKVMKIWNVKPKPKERKKPIPRFKSAEPTTPLEKKAQDAMWKVWNDIAPDLVDAYGGEEQFEDPYTVAEVCTDASRLQTNGGLSEKEEREILDNLSDKTLARLCSRFGF